MNNEGAPVLYMIEDATCFSVAQFVEPLTTKSVWKAMLTLGKLFCNIHQFFMMAQNSEIRF